MEAHESTRQGLESSLPNDHEDHIAGKEYDPMTNHNLVHKFIHMPQAKKIPDAKAAVDKEWKKLETMPFWQLDKVKSKKEVILESTKTQESPLCYIDAPQPRFRDKGRVVLRGDSVKDDSGAYAAFTEQGSSVSQMTAVKVMDVISRQPDGDGQAADAISAYTQVKMEDAPRLLNIPK